MQARRRSSLRPILAASAAALALSLALPISTADAVSIELRDVASDRIERQRRASEGKLPLPDTPDLARFSERLEERGLKPGAAMLIRIFKAESELEVWMQKDSRFVLFATYPICHWSGTLGPKIRSGDKQAPEGFYTVAQRQLHRIGRWPRSLNLGFPNVFDKVQDRTGSYILVHGGCSSVGCYAMTNTVIEEIYSLTEAAIAGGEEHVPVHVFPFRMTDANLAKHKQSEWHGFWSNLKEGYDSFERTKRPPQVSVCETKYHFRDTAPEEVGDTGPLGWCGATAAAIRDLERLHKVANLRPSSWQHPSLLSRRANLLSSLKALKGRSSGLATPPTRAIKEAILAPEPRDATAPPSVASLKQATRPPPSPPPCSLELPSCRRHIALQERIAERRMANARSHKRHQHTRTAQRGR